MGPPGVEFQWLWVGRRPRGAILADVPATLTIDDATALGGDRIDVAARVGWAVRMARLTSGVADVRLRTVAAQLGSSAARLSRMETGQLRDGRLVDGYERALGLEEGSLRAPVDVLCRTFPQLSPADADPGGPVLGVREMSALTDLLLSREPVAGSVWLRWARALVAPGNIGLRESDCRAILVRLVHELARSVSHGYPTRYEALALVRCSDYGHLVLDVAREEVARPHAQGLADLMSGVGEAVTDDAVDWCVSLLTDPAEHVAMCGALAIENMGQISGPLFWADLAPRLIAAFDATAAGSAQEEWIAHLIRLAPQRIWREQRASPSRALPPAPEIATVTRAESNRMWLDCIGAAQAVGTTTGVGDQPMLARLIYDITYGHWESRAVTGYMLLSALPGLARATGTEMARLVESADDEQVRDRAARRLVGTLQGHDLEHTARWLRADAASLRRAALMLSGSAGRRLPADELAAALRDPGTARQALYAAGMSSHPLLAAVVSDPGLPAELRGGASWWLQAGGRVPR